MPMAAYMPPPPVRVTAPRLLTRSKPMQSRRVTPAAVARSCAAARSASKFSWFKWQCVSTSSSVMLPIISVLGARGVGNNGRNPRIPRWLFLLINRNRPGAERDVSCDRLPLTAFAAALCFGLLALHFPEAGPEMKAQDALARLAPRPARPDVVIVALDQGRRRPSTDPSRAGRARSLAAGLRRIEAGKPTSVVFDLALTQRTRTGDESPVADDGEQSERPARHGL